MLYKCDNGFIHFIKDDADFDEHLRVPNRTSRIKTVPKMCTRKQC